MTKEVQDGIAARFRAVMEKKQFDVNNVAADREYIEAYVGFIHYVERQHEAAEKHSGGYYVEE